MAIEQELSTNQLPDRFPFRYELDRPAVLTAIPGVQGNAQRVVDGRGQVLRRDRVVDNEFAQLVRGADHFAGLDAAPAHASDARGGPVITACRRVDLGCTTEITEPD